MKTQALIKGKNLALLAFLFFMFPALVFAQCALMPGSVLKDGNDEAQMTGWLGNATFRGNLLYRMSRDGQSSSTFHNLCDNQGPTLVLIKNGDNGQVFGGYNPQSWTSSGNYQSGSGAFLYNLTYDYKLDQTITAYQTFNRNDYGPTFGGGHDIYTPLNGSPGYNYPHSYENPNTKGYSYLSGGFYFSVGVVDREASADREVLCVADIGVRIPRGVDRAGDQRQGHSPGA